VSINFSEIQEFVCALAGTDITELTLKSEDFELTVRKEVSFKAPVVISPPKIEDLPLSLVAPIASAVEATPANQETPSPAEKNYLAITSPMVGTFYRAPAPEEPPFVEVGDRIRLGQALCIIEAMKLMNDIEAEISGQIMEIAVSNGEPVEYGQTLMWVKPD
jgi:acetyl-CoA carboxylase biotin carboxyl carrier protein